MVADIVFLALGLKKVITYVGDSEEHELSDALTGVPVIALYGGVVLYLLAHVAFRLRNVHSVNTQRVVVAAALVALLPVASRIPALAALSLLCLLLSALIAYETVRYSAARHAIRHAAHE
jgi:hypothetical protein